MNTVKEPTWWCSLVPRLNTRASIQCQGRGCSLHLSVVFFFNDICNLPLLPSPSLLPPKELLIDQSIDVILHTCLSREKAFTAHYSKYSAKKENTVHLSLVVPTNLCRASALFSQPSHRPHTLRRMTEDSVGACRPLSGRGSPATPVPPPGGQRWKVQGQYWSCTLLDLLWVECFD